MTDLYDALDEFEAERDEGAGAHRAPSTDGVLGTEFTLEELAGRPGRWQELAQELLALRTERQAKAQTEALALAAERALDSGLVDFDDPAIQAGLRAQVESDRAAANDSFFRLRAAELRAKGFEGESVDLMLANDREAMAAVAEFMAGQDAMLDHPAYRAHETAVAVQARSSRFVRDRASAPDMGLAEAEAAIAEAYAAAAAAADAD
jgi:hypothetical protein